MYESQLIASRGCVGTEISATVLFCSKSEIKLSYYCKSTTWKGNARLCENSQFLAITISKISSHETRRLRMLFSSKNWVFGDDYFIIVITK